MYVQHRSGQGEKFLVVDVITVDSTADITTIADDGLIGWVVMSASHHHKFSVPKSDYVPCAPPCRWQDITERIEVQGGTHCWDPVEQLSWLATPDAKHGVRLRKVTVWQTAQHNNVLTGEGKMTAFVMEKLT